MNSLICVGLLLIPVIFSITSLAAETLDAGWILYEINYDKRARLRRSHPQRYEREGRW